MTKTKLDLKSCGVTLLGADCVDPKRLIWAADYCEQFCDFAAVKLLTHHDLPDARVVRIAPLDSHEAYNQFMIKNLADYVETDYVLVIQHDGYIQNPDAWTDDFLQYDYIGAPWYYNDGLNVGNGGFSLRSKRLCCVLKEDARIKQFMPEDHHICRTYRPYLETRRIRFAPEALAAKFSIEGNHKYGFCWTGQFGFHRLHSTLGVNSLFPVETLNLTQILEEEILMAAEHAPNGAVQIKLKTALKTVQVEMNQELLRQFIRINLIEPLMRMVIPGPCDIEMALREKDERFYNLELTQAAPFPGGLWLRPQHGQKSITRKGGIFDIQIPKTVVRLDKVK